MKTPTATLPLLSVVCLISGFVVQAGPFINLDFDDGVYSADGHWVTLPGWTVSYNGKVDLERNPFSIAGMQMLPNAEHGLNAPGSTYAVAPGPEDAEAVGIPQVQGNVYVSFGVTPVTPEWPANSYVSITQTGSLAQTDRYLWFYLAFGRNLQVFANGNLLNLQRPSRDPFAIADLTEFAGNDDVKLELRYTTPSKGVDPNDSDERAASFDELFFAPTNIPEPSPMILLGIGGLSLLLRWRGSFNS